MGVGGSQLATINPNTGSVTIIGPLGVTAMGAMAFAPNGTLYGATENKGVTPFGALYTINTSTGAATLVTTIRDGSNQPHPGGFSSIQFGCDGTLYYGGGFFTGDFGTIDINTGVFTQTFFQTASGSLGGLAFAEPCPIIEEDSDEDGFPDNIDNCPNDFNPNQSDIDTDGIGDVCDPETLIISNFVLTQDTIFGGNVVVQNNSLFTVSSSVTATIPSGSNITIESGSGVLIKDGGTLQIIS